MLRKEILEMPKVDLHCHLDGSLTLEVMRELSGRDVDIREMQVSDDCENLAEYLEKFDLPLKYLQTAEGLRKASKAFLLDLQKDHIKYVEVRFAPLLSVNQHLTCKEVMRAVLEGLEEAKEECQISYNVIACVMRHHSISDSLQMIKDCREFLGEGLCALDLAGNEAAYPMEEFRELFAEAKAMGYPFTLHAGECGRVENVLESVKAGASRIGHGIALRGDKEAIAFCREHQVTLEMCPISNLQTKAVRCKEDYPIREFLEEGLSVTINTDNRMVSNTSIAKEMEFVQMHYGITDNELKMLTKNALEASFADEETKQRIRAQML